MTDDRLDLDRLVTLRQRELLDEAAWARLAQGPRRPRLGLRATAARWLRAAAAWLDEGPDVARGAPLADAR